MNKVVYTFTLIHTERPKENEKIRRFSPLGVALFNLPEFASGGNILRNAINCAHICVYWFVSAFNLVGD